MLRVNKQYFRGGTIVDYDAAHYPCYAKREAAPVFLEMFGHLYGLKPANHRQCRVLELGCANGGNLWNIAELFPNSHFVGVDSSQGQIGYGKEVAENLELHNLNLICADICDLRVEEIGTFDYIVAHGLYSWVQPAVRNRIFPLCQSLLSPNGLLFVSANTKPGHYSRATARDVMTFACKDDSMDGYASMLKFLEKSELFSRPNNDLYSRTLGRELSIVSTSNPMYVLHDYLEEFNEGFYFHEVERDAEQAGLRFVTDTNIDCERVGNTPKPIAEFIDDYANSHEEKEQILDIVMGRSFREYVFCRAEQTPSRGISDAAIANSNIVCTLKHENGDCYTAKGVKLGSENDVDKLLLEDLCSRGHRPSLCMELVEYMGKSLQISAAAAQKTVCEILRRVYREDTDSLEFYSGEILSSPKYIPKFPLISRTARYFAQRDFRIPNLRNAMVNMTQIQRATAQLCDGNISTTDIVDRISAQENAVEETDISAALDYFQQMNILLHNE